MEFESMFESLSRRNQDPNPIKNKKNAIISPVDYLPTVVLGLRLILMLVSILAKKR